MTRMPAPRLRVNPATAATGTRTSLFNAMYNLYIMQTHQTLARTQIYLTEVQQKRLADASRRAAMSKSELIRLAVDQFLEKQTSTSHGAQTQRFAGLAGLWADREDMADPTTYVSALRMPRF
jgi:hypothetical protein